MFCSLHYVHQGMLPRNIPVAIHAMWSTAVLLKNIILIVEFSSGSIEYLEWIGGLVDYRKVLEQLLSVQNIMSPVSSFFSEK